MKDLFVPYELAVKLKEKGFDEPCIAIFNNNQLNLCGDMWDQNDINHISITNKEYADDTEVTTPLWQQVIDWLREEKGIYMQLNPDFSKTWLFNCYVHFRNHDGAGTNLGFKVCDFEKDYYSALQSGIEKAIELI